MVSSWVPKWAEVVLPGCLALLGVVESARAEAEVAPVWQLAVTVAMSGALAWRTVAPLPSAIAAALMFVTYPAVAPGAPESLVQAITLLIAAYAVALHARVRPALIGLLVVVVAGFLRSVLMEYDVGSVLINSM